MIKELSGGKLLGIQKVVGILPEGMEPAKGKFFTPGSLDGNVGCGILISEASKREHGVPMVSDIRFLFKEYQGVVYALVKPLVAGAAEPVAGPAEPKPKPQPFKVHNLRLVKNAPRLRGLRSEFDEAGVPLRDDQWYVCTAELVKDADEGYVVAFNWTEAATEPRDIHKERRMRAEASKRRREKKKQQKTGGTPGSDLPGGSQVSGS